MSPMKTADLYIRVSTDEQADKGYSQRSQEEILRKYCEINQISIRTVIFEDHSAKTFFRPGWNNLLIDLKRRKSTPDLVLFTKWDRFSRNAGDAYQMISILRKLNVDPQAIEQPLDLSIPENKMMLAFYLAAPEVENDRRALNVLFGMRRARKEGRWMGPAPFGYINKITEAGRKYIAPKDPEAAIIRWVFDEIAASRQSVHSIWEIARKKGLKCSRNSLWFIIRNPVYCGKIYVSKLKDEESKYVAGQHEGIVSEGLFYEIQDVLDGKHRLYQSKKETTELVLRGHLLCPNCGKQLTGSASKGRSQRYFYYHCVSPCPVRFKANDLNQLFIDELKKYVPRPGMREMYNEVCNRLYKQKEMGERDDLRGLKNELERETSRLSRARDLLLNNDIEASDYRVIKTGCEKKMVALESKLFNAKRTVVDINKLLERAVCALENLNELFVDGDLKRKRQIVGSIFPEKLIFDGINYRTGRLNEAVRLIYSLDAGFSEKKNGQTGEKNGLSKRVIRIGLPAVIQILLRGLTQRL
jgi:site-specific DNA recombinase